MLKNIYYLIGIIHFFITTVSFAVSLPEHRAKLRVLRPIEERLAEATRVFGEERARLFLIVHSKQQLGMYRQNLNTWATRIDEPGVAECMSKDFISGLILAETVHFLDRDHGIYQSGFVDIMFEMFQESSGLKKDLMAMTIAAVYDFQEVFDHLTNVMGWGEEEFDAFYLSSN